MFGGIAVQGRSYANRGADAGGRFPRGPLWQEIRQLDDPGVRPDGVRRLAKARLVFVNIPLLQHDFPFLPKDPQQVAAWFLDNAAYMSEAQCNQHDVNEPIPVEGPMVPAFRPTRYGRALVLSLRHLPGGTRQNGLFDLKGAGVATDKTPARRPYSNGLYSLGDALADTVTQWIIDAIFHRAAPYFFTVPVYGIIDPGFGILSHDNKKTIPAGLLVRRANRRPRWAAELPPAGSEEEMVKLEIEMVLRRYGITTANSVTRIHICRQNGRLRYRYGGQWAENLTAATMSELEHLVRGRRLPIEMEGINVQMTRECGFDPSYGQLIDFGHYNVVRDFQLPVASLIRDGIGRFGAAILPESRHFVRPNPRLAVSWEEWGRESLFPELCPSYMHSFPQMRRAEARCYRLAWDVAHGKIGGPEVVRSMKNMVADVVNGWNR